MGLQAKKKLERKKIRVEYFSFQGGDLLPLLVQYYYTTHYAPAPHHDPTDLNTPPATAIQPWFYPWSGTGSSWTLDPAYGRPQ